MTDGDPRPEEGPTPPAATGWSEEPAEDDGGLAPPFIPGGPANEAVAASAPAPGPTVDAPARAEPADAGPDPTEPGPAPYEPADPGEPEDDFPFEAFDIEGADQGGPRAEADAGGPAAELADRLDTLARLLRTGGAEAMEAEMSSGDRFTGLLAGLLAGYLAGRE